MVQKAADWGIESAADNDKRKTKFLEGVSQRKGRDFLRYVLEVYQDEQDTSMPVVLMEPQSEAATTSSVWSMMYFSATYP